jgi:putative endonuclease
MHYVYILRSVADAEHWYTGQTDDLKARIALHNTGRSTHTAKYMPWRLHWYCAFTDMKQAIEFEHYLKSGSGRAFAAKHLR